MHVIIHGRTPSHLQGSGGPAVAEYVSGICYGAPSVRAVEVGENFVAFAEHEHGSTAGATFRRMGSFSYGAQLVADRVIALQEFGAWTFHYSAPRRTTPV